MKIKPSKDVLQEWIKIYVPEKDLFFITQDILDRIDISEVLLMPADEFFSHSSYKQINYVNSYLYWNIKNVDYVLIAEKNWIGNIASNVRDVIFVSQIQCGRGLIIPVKFVDDIEEISPEYVVCEKIIIQRAMWESLDDAIKEQLLTRMVYEWWDNGDCLLPPKSMHDFLQPFANTFSRRQGANCLAAVLFAVTKGKQEWILYEWIYQKTFVEMLTRYNFDVFVGEGILEEDVVVWQDANGIIQHAAYHIGDGLYFNKDGQMIFNAWKIVKEDQLYKDWEHFTPVKYRQFNSNL